MTHLPPTTNPSAARLDDALGWITDKHIAAMIESYSAPCSAASLRDEVVAMIDTMLGINKPEPSSDGLRTPREAARKLRCSIKTLNGHVASGALRYVNVGHGRERVRRMFADADLNDFIANQTRKDVPCPSTRTETAARRSSISISKSKVIGFMEARNRRRDAKPRR
jgi:hypothetical protein